MRRRVAPASSASMCLDGLTRAIHLGFAHPMHHASARRTGHSVPDSARFDLRKGEPSFRMKRLLYMVAAFALLVPAAVQPAMAQSQAQDLTINALQGDPDNIDPNRSSFATEAAVIRQAFQPLLRFDSKLTPQPAAAMGYDVSPDGLTYTFHLRPDG